MVKVTLDMDTFKALASDTRLDILKVLDGKKMSLKEISNATSLNKATLHEHLNKLHEAGLVKRKEREGHKWVYYKLSWKGESLLHPENTRIVVLFSLTFFTLFFGIIQLVNFARGKIVGLASTLPGAETTQIYGVEDTGLGLFQNSQTYNYIQDIPVGNQTLSQLSNIINEQSSTRGLIGNKLADSDIQWSAITDGFSQEADLLYNSAPAAEMKDVIGSSWGSEFSTNPAMVAFIQDPTFFYIAIACFILFMALFFIGIWRIWENKTPKL